MRRLEPSLMRYPAVSTFFNTWNFPTTFPHHHREPHAERTPPAAARPDYGPWGGGRETSQKELEELRGRSRVSGGWISFFFGGWKIGGFKKMGCEIEIY